MIDNALVHQKNEILQHLNEGNLDLVLRLLSFSKELWAVSGYGYKTREILDRIDDLCWNSLTEAHWKTRQKIENWRKKVAELR